MISPLFDNVRYIRVFLRNATLAMCFIVHICTFSTDLFMCGTSNLGDTFFIFAFGIKKLHEQFDKITLQSERNYTIDITILKVVQMLYLYDY